MRDTPKRPQVRAPLLWRFLSPGGGTEGGLKTIERGRLLIIKDMKIKTLIKAGLWSMAALVLAACTSEDNSQLRPVRPRHAQRASMCFILT